MNKSTSSEHGAVGHNGALKSFISRIERLNGEKDAITADTKEVYAELKSTGLDPKIVRKIIAKRKRDAAALAEELALIEVYENAIGDLAGSPLGNAAKPR